MKSKILLVIGTLILSGCGAISATQKIPDKMDKTLDQMKQLNNIVNQQPEQISFEDLLKPDLGRDLLPIPFDLMPFAQKFGQYASNDDVVEVVYLWMKKLNELMPDSASPTPDQVAAFNHHKLHVYSALEAVCGLLPEDKVHQIVATEIDGDGRFQESAMQLLMLRARFLRDVMLEASLFSTPLDNVGKLEKAVEYANSIDYIARLPFASELSIKITGFLPPIPTIQETFDRGLAQQTWQKIKTKADNYLTVKAKSWTGNPAKDRALYLARVAREQNAMRTVNARLNYWAVPTRTGSSAKSP